MRKEMNRVIAHVDMDAFFAAIEQLDNAEWRGRPVVVGADPLEGTGRGVVATCSYEARQFGIHSAQPISRAYRRCPHAVFVRPRGARYAEVSHRVMEILRSFTPDVEPVSIDEAFLDLSSTFKFYGTPTDAGQRIKREILSRTGLIASVGIAPNKFIAKIASDLDKPDGLVVVDPGNEAEFLAPLELRRLWGVGPRTLNKLETLGLYTIGDLARLPRERLYKLFGTTGLGFWKLSHGIDERPVVTTHEAKSVSKERTFSKDVSETEALISALISLCDELSYDLRRKSIHGRTITLKIRFADFTTYTRSQTLAESTCASETLCQTVRRLFAEFKDTGRAVRLLGVGVSQLDTGGHQLDLFSGADSNRSAIDSVMDDVKKKFGDRAITRARLLRRDSPPPKPPK
jgi:nucleotidyltransferase/DNA polymerase involved in DNA repair